MNNRFLMAGAVVTLALVLLVAYLVGMWAWIFLGVGSRLNGLPSVFFSMKYCWISGRMDSSR
jgi:hypothetical protein